MALPLATWWALHPGVPGPGARGASGRRGWAPPVGRTWSQACVERASSLRVLVPTVCCFFCSLERRPFTWQLATATPTWSSYCAASAPIPTSRTRCVVVAAVLTSFCSLHGVQADSARPSPLSFIHVSAWIPEGRVSNRSTINIHLFSPLGNPLRWVTVTIILILQKRKLRQGEVQYLAQVHTAPK